MIKKTLPLYASIDPDIPLILIGDEHRIRQIIFNLLSNALKFTEQGHVSLSVTAQAGNTPNWVNLTIAVEDSGIGISPQALTTIFNQFSQADTSTTRRFGGSGLGLAITKSIIEKMGGKITATSEEGKGSVFTVNLSLEVDNEKEQKRQQSLKLLSGIKLLAHTDFAGSFKAITPHILHWGMNIDICEDEEHALELLKNGQYDGLITIHMGQPWQVLKRLKECQLPILMMHYGPLEKQAIEWDNLVVSMPLPISIQKLADSINRLFDGNAPVTEVNKLDSAVNVSSDTSILVVEDNPTNQLVVKGMLKRLGVNADLAENGEQAVLMSLRKHYQIILMDCEMPIMDGFEASEKILAVETDSKPIIIALTAHAMDETRQHCLDSGMSHVLHKPITLAKLQDCLNKSGLSSIGKPD